ncbi:unnamed protein product [Strongylus vulgaris]|uniref:Uncharacterized protein n=1 Tax=Strongylus vulgaris TaxID=40348 RepID=A0A3P7J4N6_STRVU|nr:unnamed protein product [Strongylus vulgaris]
MGRLSQRTPLKREAEAPLDRPQKRALLDAPPSPRPTSVGVDPWQNPSAVTTKPLYPKAYSSVSFTPPTEKSFFRMELPSVPPRIYFDHRLEEQEDVSEVGPPQARIAPAAPLSQGLDFTYAQCSIWAFHITQVGDIRGNLQRFVQ